MFRDEVYQIVGAAMEVHTVMGPGFLEAVYQECLARECSTRGIPHVEHPHLEIAYKGQKLNKEYVPDFIMFDQIVVEIKAASKCTPVDEAQVLNAALIAGRPLGLLINFGERSLYWKRYATRKITEFV